MVFWKSPDFEQVQGLINKNPSISFKIEDVDVFVKDFNLISGEGDILLVMSNGNFDNLSSKILEITKDE
jgi:UDP-N-acetylmuramate-alanine ligase